MLFGSAQLPLCLHGQQRAAWTNAVCIARVVRPATMRRVGGSTRKIFAMTCDEPTGFCQPRPLGIALLRADFCTSPACSWTPRAVHSVPHSRQNCSSIAHHCAAATQHKTAGLACPRGDAASSFANATCRRVMPGLPLSTSLCNGPLGAAGICAAPRRRR